MKYYRDNYRSAIRHQAQTTVQLNGLSRWTIQIAKYPENFFFKYEHTHFWKQTDLYHHSFKLANTVSIHTRGTATIMQTYRPIALLQVLYKIFVGLLKIGLNAWYVFGHITIGPNRANSAFDQKPDPSYLHSETADGNGRTYRYMFFLDWKMEFDYCN